MTDGTKELRHRRAIVDGCALLAGVGAGVVYVVGDARAFAVLAGYGILLGTSTSVVTYSLLRFTGLSVGPDSGGQRDESGIRTRVWRVFTGRALQPEADGDTGWLIGRLENVLVLTLVLLGQYTALSIIFAAKSWVRHEDTASGDSTYYLAGTLVNFTYSIAVGMTTLRILG